MCNQQLVIAPMDIKLEKMSSDDTNTFEDGQYILLTKGWVKFRLHKT